jgi:hypothetical protein
MSSTEISMIDKEYGAGPVVFPLKVWIMILLVVVGVYIYYTKYYVTTPVKSLYYY